MKLITELNQHNLPVTPEISANLSKIFALILELQEAYGSDFKITSGLRSKEGQADLIAKGLSKASKSHHLTGEAVDIYDPHKYLANYLLQNLSVLRELGLWMENPTHTLDWVHVQTVPPNSGNRVFNP